MTDYRQKIINLLPQGYAELFGRDDHETDYPRRDAAGPPPDGPGPADSVKQDNRVPGYECSGQAAVKTAS